MTHGEPVAGVQLPPELFPAALLGALLRQEGGTVTVSEEVYRQEARRVLNGTRARLSVEDGPDGQFTVRINDDHPAPSQN